MVCHCRSPWRDAVTFTAGAFLSGLSLILSAQAAAPAPDGPPKLNDLIYVTRNQNMQELGEELGRLYVSALNQGRLTVGKYQVDPNESIENVFRRNNLFKGTRFPLTLDSLACDLNILVCQRDRIRAEPEQLRDITAHILGFKPSRSSWQLVADGSVVLPAIQFEERTKWTRYKKKKGEPIEQILANLGGCSELERCKREIRLRNKADNDSIFDTNFEGTLILPVLTLAANIDLGTAEDQIQQLSNGQSNPPRIENIEGGVVLQELPPTRPNKTSNVNPEGEYKIKDLGIKSIDFAIGAGKSTLDPASIPAIGGNLIGGAVSVSRQSIPEPQDGGWRELTNPDFLTEMSEFYKLLKWPWTPPLAYPDRFKRQVNVGIFDSAIAIDHCGFLKSKILTPQPPPGPVADATGPKKCMRLIKADEDKDHGTHVAGIVVASDPAGPQVGLNPNAAIFPYTVNFTGLPDSAELDAFARDLDKAASSEPSLDVANISFGYLKRPANGPIDPIENVIVGLERQTLFVAAAGNYGANQTNICDIRPACFDLPNVISVAALDREDSPALYKANGKTSSNYGSRVHIGAVGKQVLSTVRSGEYAYMSGTSSAAPQVSAVASLLIAKYKNLFPIEVKNRLIYCSNAIDKLGDQLFGGRLDAACVLNGDFDNVKVESDEEHQGVIQKRRQVRLREKISGRELTLLTDSIRGIYYAPAEQVFTVFYNAGNSRDSRLYKETNLQPSDDSQSITLARTGKPTLTILFKNIRRFTSSAVQ
jgi:subtilisin family serine protease